MRLIPIVRRAAVVSMLLAPAAALAQPPVTYEDFEPFVAELQGLVETANRPGFGARLSSDNDSAAAREFAENGFYDGVTRAVVQPRFLLPMEDVAEGTGYQLTVEVFTEMGDRGRLQTWQLDLVRSVGDDGTPGPWQIADQLSVDTIEGLHHLTLNTDIQYDATGLVIAGEDLSIRMNRGAAFVAEADTGVTALVLVGNGVLGFSPAPPAERRQVELFAGEETLEAEFTHAFVRLNPATMTSRVSTAALVETSVDSRLQSEAQALFDEFASRTFTLDLSDLSDRAWWLTPSVGDFVSEVRTRRFGDLTYSQAQNQPEDISLYSRDPQRIIALYSSVQKRAVHGRYYSDPDLVPYDVLDYDIEASFAPRGMVQESLSAVPRLRGCWIEGSARLVLRVKRPNLTSLTLRLSDELRVHSVVSRELGPLLFFRMTDQNNVVVNLPAEAPIGTEFSIVLQYSGLLEPDVLEENWIGRVRMLNPEAEPTFAVATPRYLYTNASYWYPQSTASDFATATMTLTVPADYGVVASGDPVESNPPVGTQDEDGEPRTFRYIALQPTRYLSCLVTQFVPVETTPRELTYEGEGIVPPDRPGVSYESLSLSVQASEFSEGRAGEFMEKASEILRFYAELIGDFPYPTFTLALSDSRLPGGHSPGYFAILNQPLPMHGALMRTWRTDPVALSNHPSFFVAHELAHQWWGQAVGWNNYHEQWLSEGLAQYFAALYLREEGGEEAFEDVLAEFRRWSLRHTDQGPIYLGYRLGQIDGEPRVFRALVYNKAALVLHMLRRLIGDTAFFDGVRRFYNEHRFQMAGTDDLIRAFESESNRSLQDFFERWIHGFELPQITFSYETAEGPSGSEVVLRFDQQPPLFELPVTARLRYQSGNDETVVVPVLGRQTEIRVPLADRLRNIEINEDNAALAEIRR